jgi:hypothetical protein
MSYAAEKNCMSVDKFNSFVQTNSLSPLFIARTNALNPNKDIGYAEFISDSQLVVFSLNNKTSMVCKVLQLQNVTVIIPKQSTEKQQSD